MNVGCPPAISNMSESEVSLGRVSVRDSCVCVWESSREREKPKWHSELSVVKRVYPFSSSLGSRVCCLSMNDSVEVNTQMVIMVSPPLWEGGTFRQVLPHWGPTSSLPRHTVSAPHFHRGIWSFCFWTSDTVTPALHPSSLHISQGGFWALVLEHVKMVLCWGLLKLMSFQEGCYVSTWVPSRGLFSHGVWLHYPLMSLSFWRRHRRGREALWTGSQEEQSRGKKGKQHLIIGCLCLFSLHVTLPFT